MYLLKDPTKITIINQSQLAKKIGVNNATLNRIFNQKQSCSKIMAYAIVKSINENAEIEDYFVEKGELKMKKYINEMGTIINIIEEDEKYVTYKFESGYAKCVEKNSFDNMIKLNNYKEI